LEPAFIFCTLLIRPEDAKTPAEVRGRGESTYLQLRRGSPGTPAESEAPEAKSTGPIEPTNKFKKRKGLPKVSYLTFWIAPSLTSFL